MKLLYRPEIDGLRAIAISAVILYHAQITILGHIPFKGGFIGVDIFFVISGYLITSIILKELVTTGSFSFKYFYERRIIRILPVLVLTILASLPFAWIYLLPSSFVDFSKSILYSLGFTSNLYFHYSGQVYGAENGLFKPFLHTWSLSIEEQYYFLFPLVFFFFFKYFRKYLIYILILVFILSLGLADWGSRNHPSFNFYILPTRVWELIAGSILAYFEITKGHRSKNLNLNSILPVIGFILIIYSIIYFNDKMFHPSFYTLFPVAGACLIIWFSNKGELITRILSSKLFVRTGLISYSLYLWHYPIFAFARINDVFDGGIIYKLIFVLITIILSITTYNFIEVPSRNRKKKTVRIFYYIYFTTIFLITINLLSLFYKGFSFRVPELLRDDLSKRFHLVNEKNEKCQNHPDGCSFNATSNKKIFIVGDSHMAALAYDLKDRVISKSYQFNTSIFGGCLFFPGFNTVEIKTKKITRCDNKYFSNLEKKFEKEKNSIIILGGRYPLYLSNNLFNNQEGGIEGYEYSTKLLPVNERSNIKDEFIFSLKKISLNNYVILIYPIPEVGWNLPKKILSQINKNLLFLSNEPINKITTSYKVYKNRTKSSFELLDSIQDNNIYRVYPHTLFCDKIIRGRCLTHDDKHTFYTDTDHPSLKGARMINDLIIKEIEKIELKFK
jgi:peptidoglycan/LPS O-acetylase OafA/YrhL